MKQRNATRLTGLILWLTLLLPAMAAQADDYLKPFVLAEKASGSVSAVAEGVQQKLQSGGFEVVGSYTPYAGAEIIVVTSDALKQAATKSEFGGYGAVQRVAVTQVGDEIQVAYTNPVYWANAYRMADDLSVIAAQLEKALGKVEDFGSKKGLTAKKLRKYHYMFGMEYFDDPSELAVYDDHKTAVQAVEIGLAARRGGTSKVYRVDLPEKDETLFGVALDNTVECSGDEDIMQKIDFKPLRSTPHLPYEILVSGNQVYALYARFRIAISFPDLSMMGGHSFMKIMCAPKAIEKALELAAGHVEKKMQEEDE